jgi:hypothetical protein
MTGFAEILGAQQRIHAIANQGSMPFGRFNFLACHEFIADSTNQV